MAPIRRILLIRTSALGDIVHCLPAFVALRLRFPKASFAWVVERGFIPLLAGYSGLDRLITTDFRRWQSSLTSTRTLAEMRSFRAELRSFRADVAIDLMGNHKAASVAKLSGAKHRIGLSRKQRREPSSAIWINDPVTTVAAVHAVDRALAIANHLGAARSGSGEVGSSSTAPDLGNLDADFDADFAPDELLPDEPADTVSFLAERRNGMVLIQAGAGWANKTYPAELWGEVAKIIHRRSGLAVWVPVAPGEEDLAAAVVAASDGSARSVDAGPLPALGALLRHSRLVLGGDTGPIHLAHALGTPVLCVIGPTDPRRNGPYRAADQTIWHQLECSCCYRRFREPKPCLLSISPHQIADRAVHLLAAGSSDQNSTATDV